MTLKASIPFTISYDTIMLAPTRSHCSKGQNSSASISTMDVIAIDHGLKTTIQVWDQVERKMYVFDAKSVVPKLYFCGSSEYMAFKFKLLPVREIK